MVEVEGKVLRQIQLTELELLKEVDRICKLNGIQYNIIAGTLIGSIRHGGFIPWDDDADVALLRPEYDRFVEACRRDLDHERFYFQDIDETPGYRWGYGKLRRKDTVFLRANQEDMPYEQGICIDVFPMDAVPDTRFGRKLTAFQCLCLRKVMWSKIGRDVEPNPAMRLVFRALSHLSDETVRRRYHQLVERAYKRDSQWVRILTFPTPNREHGYLRTWYARSAPFVFEGYTFDGIADADDYLSFKFGDYLSFPPEEERRPSHPVSALRPAPDWEVIR